MLPRSIFWVHDPVWKTDDFSFVNKKLIIFFRPMDTRIQGVKQTGVRKNGSDRVDKDLIQCYIGMSEEM